MFNNGRCVIVAEVGINHNGNVKTAHRMIDAAANAGVWGVKFQSYRTEDFLGDRHLTYEYESASGKKVESQYKMFKRCEFAPSVFAKLKLHCTQRRIHFLSTPTSINGVKELVGLKADVLKNGSDFLTHLNLIRCMAHTGLPTILSTGMSTLAEIDDAVRAFRLAGGKKLMLLKCTSTYPTPARDVNLRAMSMLSTVFGCLVGLSDHTSGITAALGAVGLGACLIEKHFTLNKNAEGPDHSFSADLDELNELVRAVSTLEKQMGTSTIGPALSEQYGRAAFRLSCVAAHDLRKGHILMEDDITFHRPGTNLPPSYAPLLVGKSLRVLVRCGSPLVFSDLEGISQ